MSKNTLATVKVIIGKHALCVNRSCFSSCFNETLVRRFYCLEVIFFLTCLTSLSSNAVTSLCPNRETQLLSHFEMSVY